MSKIVTLIVTIVLVFSINGCSKHYQKIDKKDLTINIDSTNDEDVTFHVNNKKKKAKKINSPIKTYHVKYYVKKALTNMREGPSTNDKIIEQLEKGEFVYFMKDSLDWKKVMYDELQLTINFLNDKNYESKNCKIGWIYSPLLTENYVCKLTHEEKEKIEEEKFRNEILQSSLTSDDFKNYIRNGQIVVGMYKKHVRASWGKPSSKNKTTSIYGNSETWFYEKNFKCLFFENGILTIISDY